MDNPPSQTPEKTDVRYSVIAPVYNEQALCLDLCKQLGAAMDETGETYELIIVDDGSDDSTHQLLIEESKSRPELRVVRLSRNFGQEPAVCGGIKLARGRELILIDGDLQDPPTVILDMIAKKRQGYDVVFGKKKKRKEGIFRRLLTQIFYLLMHFFSQIRFPMDAGIFSLMDKEVGEWLTNFPEPNKHVSGLRTYIGFNQGVVEYDRAPRAAGEEKNLYQLIRMGLNAFFAFSMFPLRLVGGALFVVFLWGVGIIIHSLVMLSKSAPDAAVITAHTDFFYVGCLTVFALTFGVMAEYLGRSFEMAKGRPTFIIASVGANGRVERLSVDGKPSDG